MSSEQPEASTISRVHGEPNSTIGVRVPLELRRMLDVRAEELGITLSELIRRDLISVNSLLGQVEELREKRAIEQRTASGKLMALEEKVDAQGELLVALAQRQLEQDEKGGKAKGQNH